MRKQRSWLVAALALVALACGDDGSSTPLADSDTGDTVVADSDAAVDTSSGEDADGSEDGDGSVPSDVADAERRDAEDTSSDPVEDAPPPFVQPEPTDEARARGFRLYYRERVDRALTAYNRFGVFGDADFAVAVDKAYVSFDGSRYDVVVGPNDNNLIGTPVRAVWHAWKHLRTERAELTLRRLLRGLAFYEEVTGHPGLTSRMAMPGWTLGIDGESGEVTRTRSGEPVDSPMLRDDVLAEAVVDAFFDDVDITYRMDARDTMLTFYPGQSPGEYAVTFSIPELPNFIRVSDCCATLFRTPEGNRWADAWWSNHNSRDNFPDLALGLIAAWEILAAEDVPEAITAEASRVREAGDRITSLIEENGGNIMTVDEYNPYDTLVISGTVRPHGLPENEGLGGMSSCPMALLNRAMLPDGLTESPEDVWLPGTPEHLITPDIEAILECPFEEPRRCVSIDDAWCGHTWSTMFDLQVLGQPWLELARNLEEADPGSSQSLLGSFQNDFDDVVESMAALIAVLELRGQPELAAEARTTLGHMTDLMRAFADILYGETDPPRAAAQRYEAAVFDALGGIEVIVEDLADLATEDARLARIEALLSFEATAARTLLSDEEIATIVREELEGLQDRSGPGRSDAIRARYAEHYPDGEPPIRRAGDAYEARQGDGPWLAAERPSHARVGGMDLLQGIVLCSTSPYVVSCDWARLGCERPDLDSDGDVDEDDRSLFDAAIAEHGEGGSCGVERCDGADLDGSGVVDASDRAFMEAAMGCHYAATR